MIEKCQYGVSRRIKTRLNIAIIIAMVILILGWLFFHQSILAKAAATTYYVCYGVGCSASTTHDSINMALADAIAGDTILVATGVYSEDLVIDKSITLQGGWDKIFSVYAADTYTTTVQGTGAKPVIQVTSDAVSVIKGLKITGGYTKTGGGIQIWYAGGTIEENIIVGNFASGRGAGIAIVSNDSIPSSIQIINNKILENNTANGQSDVGIQGAGIYVLSTGGLQVKIQGNEIHDNIGDFSSNVLGNEGGGGIYIKADGAVPSILVDSNVIQNNIGSLNGNLAGGIEISGPGITLTNNIIANNRGGVYGNGGNLGNSWIVNNTIVNNSCEFCSGITLDQVHDTHFYLANNIVVGHENFGISVDTHNSPNSFVVEYNDAWGNGDNFQGWSAGSSGNISVFPFFRNENDWHLSTCSMLIDAGTNNYALVRDFEGDLRPYNSISDIGADEYVGGSNACHRNMLPMVVNGLQN
jgi:hypothetical protein